MAMETFEEWKARTGKEPTQCPTPKYEQSKNSRFKMRDLADPKKELREFARSPMRTSLTRRRPK